MMSKPRSDNLKLIAIAAFLGFIILFGEVRASEAAQFLGSESGFDAVSIDEQTTAVNLREVIEAAQSTSRNLTLTMRGDAAYAHFSKLAASDALVFAKGPKICLYITDVNLTGNDIGKSLSGMGGSLSAVILDNVDLGGTLSLQSVVAPTSVRIILKHLPAPCQRINLGSGIFAIAVEDSTFLVGSISKIDKPLASLTLVNAHVGQLDEVGSLGIPQQLKSLNLIDMNIDVTNLRHLLNPGIDKIRVVKSRFDNSNGSVFSEFSKLNLDTLIITNCQSVNDSDLAAGLPKRARYLAIIGSSVTDVSIPHILGIEGLEWLSLSKSAISTHGAALLINSGRLKDIGLDGTQIDDALSGMITREVGGNINLSSTRMSESGVLNLIVKAKFTAVNLGKMKVTKEFLSSARKYVPEIRVIAEDN